MIMQKGEKKKFIECLHYHQKGFIFPHFEGIIM